MGRLVLFSFTGLVFLFAFVSSSAAIQSDDWSARAKSLVNDLAAGQFNTVEAQFSSAMSSALPESKLSAAWHAVVTQAGDFKLILDTNTEEMDAYHVVHVTCRFLQNDLELRVAFDANGQVAGLRFLPAKARLPMPKPGEISLKPSDVAGDWIGNLNVGAMQLRIVFHITNTQEGLKATIDSPDQNATGLPASAVKVSGSSVALESQKLSGVFEGKISPDLSTLGGTWKQGIVEQPLVLKRVKDKSELGPRLRPQNPRKPYPYRDEDVFYDNKVQGDKLAATLTLPQGKGPFPAVVLITGSGPQDRDETLMGHKPFLVLSDYLTRHGIAVLRADDRGVAKSTGDFSGATTADFATDTEAGIAYLKSRPEVNPKSIGLIGHSEGGIIAPMIAARNPDVAFIVMLAGTGVPGDEIIVKQAELLAEAAGQSHAEAKKAGEKQRKILDIVKQNSDDALIEKELTEELGSEMSPAQIGALIRQLNLRWLRFFITYDPAQALRKVACPVLVLNGGKDMQVPPNQNLPPIRNALEESGNKNFEIDELPGLNHLFQTAKTGAPSEYAEIEETMSPVVLKKIADWILTVTSQPEHASTESHDHGAIPNPTWAQAFAH